MGEPTIKTSVEDGPAPKKIKLEVNEEDDDTTMEQSIMKTKLGADAENESASETKKAKLDSSMTVKEENGAKIDLNTVKDKDGPDVKSDIKIENGKKVETAEERGEPDLEFLIVIQIEYYFGNVNLPRDKFLQEQIKLDDGWIPLDVMLKFKRLSDLSKNSSTITTSLRNSSKLMEVNEDGSKIRRSPSKPLPTITEEWQKEVNERTVYCKGFPPTLVNLDSYIQFFKPYGPVENINLRWYTEKGSKERKYKGSLYVLFETKELAEKFLAIDKVSYADKELIRTTHAAHVEEKLKERNERWGKKLVKDIKEEPIEEEQGKVKKDLAKGCILKISGINKEDLSWEVIKSTLTDLGADVAFIQFSRGEKEAFVRLHSLEDGAANQFLKKLAEKEEKIKFGEEEVQVSTAEGEEEEKFLEKTRQQFMNQRGSKNKRGNHHRGGHKGGFKGHHKRGPHKNKQFFKKEATS